MPANKIARASELNLTEGIFKVLIDTESDHIIGTACLAEEGVEAISMLQIAMMGNRPYQELRDGIFAHPSCAKYFNTLFGNINNPESNI